MKQFLVVLAATTMVLGLGACSSESDVDRCKQGGTRCEDQILLSCSRAGHWTEALKCQDLGKFCDAAKGCVECRDDKDCSAAKPICNARMKTCQPADAKCAEGEKTCEGDSLKTCNATQTGFDETICSKASPHCDVVKGCVECRDGKDCSTAKPNCNPTTKTCQGADAVCAEGQTKCESGELSTCSSEEKWGNRSPCPNGCNNQGTGCARCVQGEKGCKGSVLMTCNATQTDFEQTICDGSTPYCDNDKGCVGCRNSDDCESIKFICNMVTHSCELGTCQKGDTKCAGNQMITCTGTGEWPTLGTACTEGPCNSLGTACAVCLQGDAFCTAGNTLTRCNPTQTDYEKIGCTSPAPFCSTSQGGRCVECTKIEHCKDKTKPICNTATMTCESGAAACSEGQTKCEDGTSFSCSKDGTWLKSSSRCFNGCNLEGIACAVCKKGDTMCVGTDKLQTCNAKLSGYDETVCKGATPYCDVAKGCVECKKNGDCKDPKKPNCNVTTRTCGK